MIFLEPKDGMFLTSFHLWNLDLPGLYTREKPTSFFMQEVQRIIQPPTVGNATVYDKYYR